MIDLVIWSKDRACQLSALIDSIKKFAPNTFAVSIIYTFSDEQFELGYNKCRNHHHPVCNWQVEKDFQQQTIDALQKDYVAFATDDTVLYKNLPLVGEDFKRAVGVDVFSLRYGRNTIVQDCHRNTLQPPLNRYKNEGNTIAWKFTDYHPLNNYGYPFGLDFHVYPTKIIKPILEEIDFNSSNQLETRLQDYRHRLSGVIRSFHHSVAVNVPINNQSTITKSGLYHSATLEELNQQFLDGYEIDINHWADYNIAGAHQELPIRWRKNPDG